MQATMPTERYVPPAAGPSASSCPRFLTYWGEGRRRAVSMFETEKMLGRGSFGSVYEVRRASDGAKFALKVIPKARLDEPRERAKLQSEIAIHSRMRHENVARFLTSWDDPSNVYLLMELCPGRTLEDVVNSKGSLSEAEAAHFMDQILEALDYIHSSRVVHRDIKLANLLISSDGCIKAGDFGFATQLDYAGQLRHAKCGTPDYVAPEVLADGVGHSHEVDVWAVGCMLYAMLYGKPPFQTSSIETTFERVRKIDYAFPDSPDVSQEAKDLIRSILVEDPKQRPSLAEIARSAWLTKNRDPAKDVPAFAADGAAPTAPYQGLHYAGVVTTHPRRHSLSERPSGAHPLACRAPVAPVTPEEPSTSEPEATTSPAAPEGGASERPVSDPYEDEYFHGSVRRTIISQIPGATFFQRSDSSIEVEFSDSASLYVSGDRSQVIMVRGGEATMHSMDRLPEDPDLIRRLTFTRDVLREIEAAAELS